MSGAFTNVCSLQISDALAPENQPDYKQLGNTTYLMEQYEKLVAGLENPLAIAGGGSVFSYSPCFINFDPAGAPTYHSLQAPQFSW